MVCGLGFGEYHAVARDERVCRELNNLFVKRKRGTFISYGVRNLGISTDKAASYPRHQPARQERERNVKVTPPRIKPGNAQGFKYVPGGDQARLAPGTKP